MLKEQLGKRIEALKSEFESGRRLLAEQEAKVAGLKESLLRISGAIQVLEEELAKLDEASTGNPLDPAATEPPIVLEAAATQ